MIHKAITKDTTCSVVSGEPDFPVGQWFASLDGDTWLPVTREPEPGDRAAIEKLFAPVKTARGHFSPMKYAARYLRWCKADFSTCED